jgi:ribose transport system ATP-binding protein
LSGLPAVGAEVGSELTVSQLSKTFPGQRALDGVDFDVRPAEVHALVGHNGSGKSTLLKILAGYHVPDRSSGRILVGGTRLRFGDPASAHDVGLRFIHQELGLVDDLSILENLRLGTAWNTGVGRRIRWRRERQSAREALQRVGLNAHPDALVRDLGAIQRTQVAVARALQDRQGARFLFLDEPTATLPASEVDRLFALIRATVAQGLGVVYISHRLAELFEISDRVTVLRDGRVVGSGDTASFTRDQLVELIVGSPQSGASCPTRPATVKALGYLSFDDIHAGDITGMSFSMGAGEIVGMAGLVGSGVHDVPSTLLGRVAVTRGSIRVEGSEVQRLSPHELLARGIAVLPSARALRNIPSLSVRENLTLPDLRPLWRRGRLRLRYERAVVRQFIERFRITPAQTERIVAHLSGGNQQKVSIAKWMRLNPRLLVLDEPTQGVDIGARREILNILREASRDGVAILICSSDLEDLADICHRVLVVRDGRVGSELSGASLTQERIAEESYAVST